MKIFWIFALALLRPAYLIYSLLCLLAPIFILCGIAYGLNCLFFHAPFPAPDSIIKLVAESMLLIYIVIAITLPILVYKRKAEDETEIDPDPFQSAFMSWFGTIRWYWNTTPGPMAKVGLPSGYLVENPMNYRLTAKDMRDILSKLQPGDILLRAYDGYLDGQFIRHSSLCSKNGYRSGWFTHAALYVGSLTDQDREKVPAQFQQDKKYFQEGSQMVLHSMAKGVHAEDILTWFRCDYLAVLRVKSEIKNRQLKNGSPNPVLIDRDTAIQNAKLSALGKIGEPYDFECIETDKFTRFSCAELVYFCYRSIHDALGLSPQLHAFYPLGKLNRHWHIMGRSTITPDDFYNLAKEEHFDIIWVDKISKHNA